MANIRAMTVFQAFTELPEDQYVNTFHFSNGMGYAAHVDLAELALDDFWNTVPSGGDAVSAHLSPVVNDIYRYKFYNLADPEPREPIERISNTATRESGVGVPEEVAVCLSYNGAPPVTARRRGRIYVGPLNNASVTAPDSDSFSGISAQFSTALLAAAVRLSNFAIAGNDVGWCIRSSVPAENFVPIVGGWVDSRLDTQRRRGPESNGRLTWVA